MRKLIALFSVLLMAGCALALAADSDSSDPAYQQPGAAENPSVSQDMSKSTTETMKSATESAKNVAKTCVDETGKTLKKGQKGFNECLKSQMSKQESGTAANPPTSGTSGSDTSTSQGSMGDTSSQQQQQPSSG